MAVNKKLYIILFYFLLLSILFVLVSPVFETPDEDLHLQYINYISMCESLPNQYEGIKIPALYVGQGHQHPLYYILTGAIIYVFHPNSRIEVNAVRNKLHEWNGGTTGKVPCYNHTERDFFPSAADIILFYSLRILSVFFGLINIIFIYKIAKLIFPDSDWLYLPVVFAATLPQFLFITGSINSDNPAGMFSTIIIYFTFKILKDNLNIKNYILLGIFLGLGILTKKTLLFTVPGIVFMFGYVLYKRGNFKKYVSNFSITFLLVVIISAWFFFRNYYVYGGFLGTQMEIDTMPYLVNADPITFKYFFLEFLPQLYHSFIAKFGWMNLMLPIPVYIIYTVIFLCAGIGLVMLLKKERFNNVYLLFTLLFIFICFFGVFYFNLTFRQPQGRYMFPVLSLVSLLFGWGIKEFSGLSHNKYFKRVVLISVLCAFVIMDIVCLLTSYEFYHNPANYP